LATVVLAQLLLVHDLLVVAPLVAQACPVSILSSAATTNSVAGVSTLQLLVLLLALLLSLLVLLTPLDLLVSSSTPSILR